MHVWVFNASLASMDPSIDSGPSSMRPSGRRIGLRLAHYLASVAHSLASTYRFCQRASYVRQKLSFCTAFWPACCQLTEGNADVQSGCMWCPGGHTMRDCVQDLPLLASFLFVFAGQDAHVIIQVQVLPALIVRGFCFGGLLSFFVRPAELIEVLVKVVIAV